MPTKDGFICTACWFAVLAATIWLLLPAISPVHVEGFSASIVSLGLHFAQGTVSDFYPYAPLSADYFGLTKFGAMLGVAKLSPILGGDGAMRIIMHLGLALSLASSAYLVKAWSGASWLVVAVAMIVVPGTVEAAFYFNDNLPASGLLFVGLALLVRWPSPWIAIPAGVLIGCSISVRFDMILITAAAVPISTWKEGLWRTSFLASAIAAMAAVATLFALFAIAKVTPLDALRAGLAQVEVWDRPLNLTRQLIEFLYFTGIAGGMLAVLGVLQLVRMRHWYLLTLLVGIPLFINLAQLGTLWQARQFLPLLPFLCALVARGISTACDDFRAGNRAFPIAIAALALAVLAGPIRGVILSDGPHEFFGRFAGIALWTDWQEQVRHDFRQVDKLIDTSGRPGSSPLMVITDYWNEDRYLHLRLIERGFRRMAVPSACGIIGEGFRKADQKVIHFSATFRSMRARQLEEITLPCARMFPAARLVLLAESDRSKALTDRVSDKRPIRSELAAAGMTWLSTVPLDTVSLEKLKQTYSLQAEGDGGPQSLEAVRVLNRSRTAFSK